MKIFPKRKSNTICGKVFVEPPELGKDFDQIIAHIRQEGGQPYLVGGFIRDYLCGHNPKDKDIEVYGMTAIDLIDTLNQYGCTNSVGASFGVIKFTHPNGDEYDFSLPRRENKQGQGYKGFQVEVDPTMTFEESTSRRDFAYNAMMMNPTTGEIIDYHNGWNDLANGELHHVGPAFAEDPLRPLRGMQFAARFGHTMNSQTAALCRQLFDEYNALSSDRIMIEWQKMAQKGKFPSKGLQVLVDMGWDKHYPELIIDKAMMKRMDRIADIIQNGSYSNESKEVFFFTALTFDIESIPQASFMHRINMPHNVEKRIRALQRGIDSTYINHLDQTRASVQNLAYCISPETITDLVQVLKVINHPNAQTIGQVAEQYGVNETPPKPFITGEDLKEMGFKQGKEFGNKLKDIYQAQLDCVVNTREEALAMARGG